MFNYLAIRYPLNFENHVDYLQCLKQLRPTTTDILYNSQISIVFVFEPMRLRTIFSWRTYRIHLLDLLVAFQFIRKNTYNNICTKKILRIILCTHYTRKIHIYVCILIKIMQVLQEIADMYLREKLQKFLQRIPRNNTELHQVVGTYYLQPLQVVPGQPIQVRIE